MAQSDGNTVKASMPQREMHSQAQNLEGLARNLERHYTRGKAHSKNKNKDEICGNWNLKISTCSAEGPCHYGRMHKCSRCGGGHRLVDCKASSEG